MTELHSGTVYVVDDDPAVRDAIKVLAHSVHLSAECFGSASAFLEAYRPTGPSCLVTDVFLPGMDGVALQQALAERDPALPIVVISGHGDIAMAVEMMRWGAMDFIEKPFRNHVLLQRIQEALQRDTARWRERQAGDATRQRLAQLTRREAEVACRLVRGASNKEVARDLDLSPRTVEAHRASVMRKLEVRSIAELTYQLLSDGCSDLAGDSTPSP